MILGSIGMEESFSKYLDEVYGTFSFYKIGQPQVDTKELLTQRGKVYGDIRDNMRTKNYLVAILNQELIKNDSYLKLNQNDKHGIQGCIETICLKLARAVTGDICYDDNWKDIGGYAKLIEDIVVRNVNERLSDTTKA